MLSWKDGSQHCFDRGRSFVALKLYNMEKEHSVKDQSAQMDIHIVTDSAL